jgi:hypothetical protein
MFEIDFSENTDGEKVSVEDRRFIQRMSEGIHVREDGHLEMPLPHREDRTVLPNNKSIAVKRLGGLKAKMLKDPKYRQHYTDFMNNLLANGNAEIVPEEEIYIEDGSVWYIPHHGVYHPHKVDKIRVVFDCSAEYNGEVLNKHLLSGPDMINNLTGILLRFRKGQIAFTCDIEGMFHQAGILKSKMGKVAHGQPKSL